MGSEMCIRDSGRAARGGSASQLAHQSSASRKMVQLSSLPCEALAHIFAALRLPELCSVACTSIDFQEPIEQTLVSRSATGGHWVPSPLPRPTILSVTLLLRLERRRAAARRRVAADTAARVAELDLACARRGTACTQLELAAQAATDWWRRSGPAPPIVAADISGSWHLIQLLHDARLDHARRVCLAAAAAMREQLATLTVDQQTMVDMAMKQLCCKSESSVIEKGRPESFESRSAKRQCTSRALMESTMAQLVETTIALAMIEADGEKKARDSMLLLNMASAHLRRLMQVSSEATVTRRIPT